MVRTNNRGLSAARNTGVASTRAPYICTVDADDILLPELFEKSIARLEADPSLGFVSHWVHAFGDESWDLEAGGCEFPALLDANAVNGAAVFRRSIVDAAGGWDETMRDGCEDWDFWITVVEQGRGAIIPEILFHYRQRPDSMSRRKFADDGHSRLYRRLVDKHPETFRLYLADIVANREAAIADLRTWSDELETKWILELQPAMARTADDLAAAEQAQTRQAAERAAREELRAAAAAVAGLERDLLAATEQFATTRQALHSAQARQRDLHAHITRTEKEVLKLRDSLSWKLTQPLRTVGAWFLSRRHP